MTRPTIAHKDPLTIPDEALPLLMQAVLSRGASFRFRAKGTSMSPFIKDGDLITITPLSVEKPALGKAAAFLQPNCGHLLVHRIVGREAGAFLLRGDNAIDRTDGWVQAEYLLGIVTRVERGGRLVRLGQGPERGLVAWMSRAGWLSKILARLRLLKHPRR